MTQRKLNMTSSHRKAVLRSLTIALVEHKQIKTTLPKAKELRSVVEKLVTKAAQNDLHTVRYLKKKLSHKESVKRLLSDLGPRYKDRNGGYTRILKIANRVGDNAPMAIIQFVDYNKDTES
jgi:large subunit ribosomal protein L17